MTEVKEAPEVVNWTTLLPLTPALTIEKEEAGITNNVVRAFEKTQETAVKQDITVEEAKNALGVFYKHVLGGEAEKTEPTVAQHRENLQKKLAAAKQEIEQGYNAATHDNYKTFVTIAFKTAEQAAKGPAQELTRKL